VDGLFDVHRRCPARRTLRRKSTYDFCKKLRLAAAAIFSFSNKLLVLVVNFGFLISFIAFMVGNHNAYLKLVCRCGVA
jgi:hypothetical protein